MYRGVVREHPEGRTRKNPGWGTLWFALPGVVGWLALMFLFWFAFSWDFEYFEAWDWLAGACYFLLVPLAAISGVPCAVRAARRYEGSASQRAAAILVVLINLPYSGFAFWVMWDWRPVF
jgi:hypothetical protein